MDGPDMIIQLIAEYPEFKAMYQQAYEICRNVEALMGIFSEELRIMDRNTVKYMVDQMQEEIDSQKYTIKSQEQQLEQKNTELQQKSTQLKQKDEQLSNQKQEIDSQLHQLKKKDSILSEKIQRIAFLEKELQKLQENHK